jgi:hypothetical protein
MPERERERDDKRQRDKARRSDAGVLAVHSSDGGREAKKQKGKSREVNSNDLDDSDGVQGDSD